ncbi:MULTISPECIES: hypothetical protein [unclassified Leptolyngbya]|uniref:hypothetical protein n=1 Tax=unclassified Leptolyngbya TaxID=2650499 RepID=UPI001685515A|nr:MULTISPECIES: hypothetical protein [unclassified Leptolyngbya]MBD1912561.1 hypothetical protein [Leptolyngbya sp. FACHB-8]MBD2158471.1 hypothetical protein [Leptolyngbya sp. FACHB-16]
MGKLIAVVAAVGVGVLVFSTFKNVAKQPAAQPQQAVDTINRATDKLNQAQQTEQQRADQIQQQDP